MPAVPLLAAVRVPAAIVRVPAAMMKARTRSRRSGVERALVGGLVGLTFFIACAVGFSVLQQGTDAVVRRALGIKINLADLLSTLQDAETGQRGYLLTGDDTFLAPYRTATVSVDMRVAALRSSVSEVKRLAVPFEQLRALVASKQAELAQTLALADQGRREEALNLIRQGSGKHLMDQIRAVIVALDTHGDAVIADREASLSRTGFLTAGSTIAAVILLAFVALAALRAARHRAQLARFLPAEIAPRLAAGDRSLLQGREALAAIAFVDICGSTGWAETLSPRDLSGLLSSFRAAVGAATRDAGGVVDKFIGDGALVVFGGVEDDPNACRKALAFARMLPAYLAAASTGLPPVSIGIHHGQVFCGIVGDADRQEFTVLGDTVNVASRLEALSKSCPGSLLVSETVLRGAGEREEAWRRFSEEPLRGRQIPIVIFASHPRAL